MKDLIKILQEKMPETTYLAKNKERYNEVKQAIQDIADFAWASDPTAKINVSPDGITGTSIGLEIITDLFIVDCLDKFCDALRKGDTFEVCPRTDGSVYVNITFEDVFEIINAE